MAFLDDVKKQLRIVGSAFDTEVGSLIDSATIDLQESGVLVVDTTDDFVAQTIILYCKGMFGYDNPEAQRFMERYEYDKAKLATLSKYNEAKIVFTVKDSDQALVEGATVTVGDEIILTNSKGIANYSSDFGVDVSYSVSKTGKTTVTGSVYVDGLEAVAVVLA